MSSEDLGDEGPSWGEKVKGDGDRLENERKETKRREVSYVDE